MGIKRIAKEIEIDNPLFTIKYGTTNRKTSKSIYIIGKTYIEPIIEDFTKSVDRLLKLPKTKKKILQGFLSNKSIFIIDIASERMEVNKKSILTFELHLLQEEIKDLLDESLIQSINEISNLIVDYITQECSNVLKLHKTKKSK